MCWSQAFDPIICQSIYIMIKLNLTMVLLMAVVAKMTTIILDFTSGSWKIQFEDV